MRNKIRVIVDFVWSGLVVFVVVAIWLALAAMAAHAQQTADGFAWQPAPVEVGTVDPLDATRETPLGVIEPGGDITKALQWACDHAHEHQRAVEIPAGTWEVSDTITTPYRSGFTLTGAGVGLERDHPTFAGVRTVLKWTGPKDGTLLCWTGSHGRCGNFTIDGGGKLGTAVLIDKPDRRGLGTGKAIFEPIHVHNTTYAVQCGASRHTHNCDNLHFRWLAGEKCEAVYRGVNTQGMDVVIDRLFNYSNRFGVLMEGGGNIWVRSSLTTSPSTLLRIPDTDGGFGPNNAFFRFSQVKVDSQAENGFQLVDCDEPAEIRILVDGGIQSNTGFKGTFAKLTGSNMLHVTDFSSTFDGIQGKRANWGTPTVLLESCRIWGKRDVAELFEGDLNVRVRDCTRTDGEWVDLQSFVPLIEATKRIKRLEKRIDGIKLEVPPGEAD